MPDTLAPHTRKPPASSKPARLRSSDIDVGTREYNTLARHRPAADGFGDALSIGDAQHWRSLLMKLHEPLCQVAIFTRRNNRISLLP